MALAGRNPICAAWGPIPAICSPPPTARRTSTCGGAMGSVSSIGLGLAPARLDQRLVVLDGEGSLLMNLGSLATISAQQPHNLVHVVFDNRMYETSGGRAKHTARGVNLAAIRPRRRSPRRSVRWRTCPPLSTQPGPPCTSPGPGSSWRVAKVVMQG